MFVTGVSKFSKVSIFSDLNNLEDITTEENFSQIVGWTKEELVKYFPEYIKGVAEKYKDIWKLLVYNRNSYFLNGTDKGT